VIILGCFLIVCKCLLSHHSRLLCVLECLFRLVRKILNARYIPNAANTQRIIPDAILCSSKFITAKTRVKPAYENTTIGRYLLTFSAISIISTINFMRSALVSSTPNHWSKNDIKVINLSVTARPLKRCRPIVCRCLGVM